MTFSTPTRCKFEEVLGQVSLVQHPVTERAWAPSARAYGSEGWGFESLRARPAQRPFPSLRKCLCLQIDDTLDDR